MRKKGSAGPKKNSIDGGSLTEPSLPDQYNAGKNDSQAPPPLAFA